jgi:hypothetical protein
MVQINKVTEWVRSKPIDKKKEIVGAIDTSNVVKGTRRRKDFDYNETLFNGRIHKPVQRSKLNARGSHNQLEQRLKNAV